MANHGALIVGKDIEEAMYFAQRLERECEIYYRSLQMGKPKPLTYKEVYDLHRRDLSYGQDPAVPGGETAATTSNESEADGSTDKNDDSGN